MIGDRDDILKRLRLVLPTGWFADIAPILLGVLSGFAAAWVRLYESLQFVIIQSRLRTATGSFIEIAAQDFLSDVFERRPNEADDDYRGRLLEALGRSRATRPSIIEAAAAAGYSVEIFEAAQPGDTGAYNTPTHLAWNTVGAWGSLTMPFESLIVAHPSERPFEDELWKNIADVTPAGGVLWMRTSASS